MHLCDVTDYHIFAGSPVCHHQAAQSSQCPSTGKTEPWWQRDRLSVPNPEHGLIHALPPGTHHYLEVKQNNNALNINYHRIYILNLQAQPEVCSADRHISTFSYSLLTSLVNVACCPRLCCIKMGITSDTLTREVCVGQETSLAVEWGAVSVKAFRKVKHDICKLVHLAIDLTVWDLTELEWRHGFPNLEGLPDGLMCGLFTNFRTVVLDTEK